MNRRDFNYSLSSTIISMGTVKLNTFAKNICGFSKTNRLPVLFIGHGNPLNALSTPDTNPFVAALHREGEFLRKNYEIHAIMIVSAHWLTKGTFVNGSIRPKVLYDFVGFPDEIYKIDYPAPGAPEIAKMTNKQSEKIDLTQEWGLDHGAWSVLIHLFPKADIPVLQLSIDYHKQSSYHYELAKNLRLLRDKGVLVIGSGNIIHNLSLAIPKMVNQEKTLYGWEEEFENWVLDKLDTGNYEDLFNYHKVNSGKLSVPTPDHYYPMFYTLAQNYPGEPIHHIYKELLPGISMRCFRVG